jgi:hypothetical protein
MLSATHATAFVPKTLMAIVLPVFSMRIGSKNSRENPKQIKETNEKNCRSESNLLEIYFSSAHTHATILLRSRDGR